MKNQNRAARIKVIAATLLFACLVVPGFSREVTFTVNNSPALGPAKLADEVTVGLNEVAEIQKPFGSGPYTLAVIKDGISFYNATAENPEFPMSVVGPASVRLSIDKMEPACWFCTVKIEPESFPPGQTIILPEGTVGTIYVESSTNLLQWQAEWSQTFSNTNQNRFFRLRAERSLP